jgi:hypothetical protein
MTKNEKVEDLIGRECVVSIGENFVPCRIDRIFIQREMKWPYMASILVDVNPLHPMELNESELDELREGVCLGSLADIEWE